MIQTRAFVSPFSHASSAMENGRKCDCVGGGVGSARGRRRDVGSEGGGRGGGCKATSFYFCSVKAILYLWMYVRELFTSESCIYQLLVQVDPSGHFYQIILLATYDFFFPVFLCVFWEEGGGGASSFCTLPLTATLNRLHVTSIFNIFLQIAACALLSFSMTSVYKCPAYFS